MAKIIYGRRESTGIAFCEKQHIGLQTSGCSRHRRAMDLTDSVIIAMSDFLVDKWEHYTIRFSIYYPLKTNEKMRINGDLPELGSWNE